MSPTTDTPSLCGPETPFSVSVPQEKRNKLQKKLELADFPDELNDRRCRTTGFDWRAQEKKLNEALPGQLTRDIKVENFGLLNIHYVHMPSNLKTALSWRYPIALLPWMRVDFLRITKLHKEEIGKLWATGKAPTFKQPILYIQHLLTPYTQKEKDSLARSAIVSF
ncbi:hypothetical protein CYLTODRAFT_450932 [Cylindrobasidium torrendii FP15055 ss-10]|uniref:Epoxide hydrolase N-terminal domain-containing protein n=1 Tax=Cylindrobasidium torrendii FP15055 ss-10 TaxID=1314674 RepID=A0A0D7BL55_9AGAR|nr:hypothetical protein CYLTODRAFT_450932 [Cylindrobasidium torrendii FP15055 ss-10]